MAKIKQLYNVNSFKSFSDSAKARGFSDSAAGVILARQLTHVDPTIFEKRYPELTLLNSGIDIDNSGGYVDRIQSLRLIENGDFKDSTNKDSDKGKISLQGEQSYLPVYEKEAFSEWSETEVRKSEIQNINLPNRYLETHNKKYNQAIDTIGYIGNGSLSEGLLNYSGFSSTTATAAIATATAVELYNDISGLIRAQWDAVYNTPEYMATRVTMPTDVYNKIAATILNTAAGASTVLKALQDNFPGIQFVATPKADSVSATSVTIAHSVSPEVMKLRIPTPLTIYPIDQRGSRYRVESEFRIAGLDILEDAGGYILTGL